jgi:hypothetical protein
MQHRIFYVFYLTHVTLPYLHFALRMFQVTGHQPGVCEDILGGTRKHLTSIITKHRKCLNLEQALILALMKINRLEQHK